MLIGTFPQWCREEWNDFGLGFLEEDMTAVEGDEEVACGEKETGRRNMHLPAAGGRWFL